MPRRPTKRWRRTGVWLELRLAVHEGAAGLRRDEVLFGFEDPDHGRGLLPLSGIYLATRKEQDAAMRLDDIRALIQGSSQDDWHVLPGDAPTYVHRFKYGSDERGDAIWGLDEHDSRAVLRSDLDVSLVWGMVTGDEPSAQDWADQLSSVNKKVRAAVAEVLYRGQPVDRVVYAIVDNAHGAVPWPELHYRPGANQSLDTSEPPESLTITAWEMAVVSLSDALGGGGGYGKPEDYARRAGITIV